MSIFSAIGNAEHTAIAWIEKEWAKFQKAAPTIEHLTEEGINYATAGLKVVLAQLDPASKEAEVILGSIKKLTNLSAVVFDFGAHPTLAGEFQVVVNDLGAILSLGGIKNANLVGGITKAVSTIAALVSAFLQIAPVVAAAV